MLDYFFVTSPWSDGRSLIAKWNWRYDAESHHFEKASIFYYSPLDEGFERTEIIAQPITTFTLRNLRPETTYFICLRVHHRLHSTKFTPIATPPISNASATNRSPINWHTRQSLNTVSPGNYAYEVRCTRATTQNWHLSALIGGVLGVVFALVLGFLLLFVLKRNQCLPSGSSSLGKQVILGSSLKSSYTQRGGSNQGRKKFGFKCGNLHSNPWPSHSFKFNRHLKEEDEDEEEDDDEVIAEDAEEDTEIDTGCKSSVRSQVGIYSGSGGTTGSSNRHSSMSSSVDAREDSSSVAMPYLPVNGLQARTYTKLSRDIKRSSFGYESIMTTSGVKVNVMAPTPDLSGTMEDLRKASLTPVTKSADYGDRKIKHGDVSSPALPSLPDPLSESPTVALWSPLVVSPSPLKLPLQFIGADSHGRDQCQSPTPLLKPQPMDLQTPVLVGMNSEDGYAWTESVQAEDVLQFLPSASCILYNDPEKENSADDAHDYESTLSLSDATPCSSSESVVSSNVAYEEYRYFPPPDRFEESKNANPSIQFSSIHAEFVETI